MIPITIKLMSKMRGLRDPESVAKVLVIWEGTDSGAV